MLDQAIHDRAPKDSGCKDTTFHTGYHTIQIRHITPNICQEPNAFAMRCKRRGFRSIAAAEE